ncbi:MAG: sulfotransferase [Methylococcales bacterium]
MTDAWPCPPYRIDKEPQFLFIATPPYSGSTALAEILNGGHRTAFLQARAEGQWLIPGMCEADRWNPQKSIDWTSVRAVWMERIERMVEESGRGAQVALVIEKSPPNLVRLGQLIEAFPNHLLMAFNRNPYASCSSILYRKYDADAKTRQERIAMVSRLAADWLFRSRWIKHWSDALRLRYFSYESFCEDPTACISHLAANAPALKSVDVNRRIKVKDYEVQGLVNFNDRQVSKLTTADIDAISAALDNHRALLAFFGYEIR